MTVPYVSSWDEEFRTTFRKAFDRAIEEQPDRAPLVKKLIDEIWEQVVTSLQDSISDYLYENMKDRICDAASKVAESMLANALAGDSKELRNLFGFNDWYMKHLYSGKLPTQWALIDALALRHKDLIVDERVKQRDAQLADKDAKIANLHRHVEYLKNPYGSEENQ